MKTKVLFILAILSPLTMAHDPLETSQCVTVPPDHKIVFVPWFVPTDELVWRWRPAREVEPTSEPEPEECGGELVVSPHTCIKD